MRMLVKSTVVVVLVAVAAVTYGHTFSIDAVSFNGLQTGVTAGDILTPGPTTHIPESLLGLVPGDDLNALSGGLDTHSVNPILFFSVCRQSIGVPGNPFVPYVSDVAVEAGVMQAAGDVFATSTIHVAGAPIPPQWATPQGYNMLHINQSELGLYPPVFQTMPNVDPNIDNLDALNFSEFDLDGNGTLDQNAYFSLDFLSPSVAGGGLVTADDILLMVPGAGAPVVYADGVVDIGLMPGDDLDALILIDLVAPGIVDPGIDQVLFSLAPGSPTLAVNGWSAADILTSNFAGNTFRAFPAWSLGLSENDNVDALEIQPGMVPEPGTMFLLGTACVAGLGYIRKRRLS